MSLGHGASIVRDGLVFQYDMGNTAKSWKGKPTTNIAYYDGIWRTTVGNLTSTGISFSDAGNNKWNVTCTTGGAFRLSFSLTYLTSGQPYCISYKYRLGTATAFTVTDWCDTSITKTETVIDDYVYVQAYGTRATYDSTFRFMDFSITGDGGTVEVWDIQLEEGNFATPFVKGVRSNTQALIDISKGGNTITANNLVYASDNTFSFDDATNSYVSTGKNRETIFPSINYYSYICVAKRNGAPSTSHSHAVVWGAQGYNTGLLWYNSNNGVNMAAWYDTSAGSGTWANKGTITSSAIANDTWVHLAGTFNAFGNMSCYVNGELVSAVDVSANTTTSNNIWYNGNPVSAGGGATAYQFNGSVPVALGYNRELTAREIKQHFDSIRGRFDI